MIGTQAAQAVVEARHGILVVPAAILGHEENLVAVTAREVPAHDFLRSSAVVVPGIVEEGDALVDRHVNEAFAFGARNPPGMGAADTQYGDANSGDRKSTRLNSSHLGISYAVFCLK